VKTQLKWQNIKSQEEFFVVAYVKTNLLMGIFYKNVSFTHTIILKKRNYTSAQLSIILQATMESGVLVPLFPNLVRN
jgi:hypothetical protein